VVKVIIEEHVMNLMNFLKTKKGYAGTFNTLGEVRSWNGRVGSSFFFNNCIYIVRANGAVPVGVVEDTKKIIVLTNSNVAFNTSSREWYGTYYGADVTTPTDNASFRLPETRRISGVGTSFNSAAATAVVTASTPVHGDIVEFVSTSVPNFSEARYYDKPATTWVKINNEINGITYNYGVLGASRLQTLSVISNKVRSKKCELVGDSNIEVRNPDGFGVNDLIYWLGSKVGKIDGNGNIDYSTLTAANAMQWISKTGSSMLGSTAPVEPNPGSNGGNVQFDFANGTAYEALGSYSVNGTTTIELEFKTNGQFTMSSANGTLVNLTQPIGSYLQNIGIGYSTGYEICIEHVSGDSIYGGFTGQLNDYVFVPLTTARVVGISTNHSGVAGSTTVKTAVIRIIVREISNHANIVTDNIALRVSRELTVNSVDGGAVAPNLNLGSVYSSYEVRQTGTSSPGVGFSFSTNGTFQIAVDPFSSGSPLTGNFLTNIGSQYANDYEIMVEYVSGTGQTPITFNGSLISSFNVWYPITQAANVALDLNRTVLGESTSNVNIRFNVRQISNHTNIASRLVNIILTAVIDATPTIGGQVTASYGTDYMSSSTVTGTSTAAATSLLINPNGTFSLSGANLTGSPTSGNWLQNIGTGHGTGYEISISQVSGSSISGTTPFTPLSAQRQILLSASVSTPSGGSSNAQSLDGTVAVTIREIANHSNTSTKNIRLRAVATSNPSVSAGGNVIGANNAYNLVLTRQDATARAAVQITFSQTGTFSVSRSANSLGTVTTFTGIMSGSWLANPGSYGSAYSFTSTADGIPAESGTLSSDVSFSAVAQTADATVGNTTGRSQVLVVNIFETNNPSNSSSLTFNVTTTATATTSVSAGGTVSVTSANLNATAAATGTTARASGVLSFLANGTYNFSAGSGLGVQTATTFSGNWLQNLGAFGSAYTIVVSGTGITSGTTTGSSLSSGRSIAVTTADATVGNTAAAIAVVNITIFETSNPANTSSTTINITASATSSVVVAAGGNVSLSSIGSSFSGSTITNGVTASHTVQLNLLPNGTTSITGASGSVGNWLQNIGNGNGSSYEVDVVQNSGNAITGTTGFVSMGGGASISLSSSAGIGAAQTLTGSVTITVRQISNPSNSSSRTITLTSASTSNAVPVVVVTGGFETSYTDEISGWVGNPAAIEFTTTFSSGGTFSQSSTNGLSTSGRWTASTDGSLYEISVVQNSKTGDSLASGSSGGYVNFPVTISHSAYAEHPSVNITMGTVNHTIGIREKANPSNSTSLSLSSNLTARSSPNIEP
jgi:hypothetical protein